MLRKILILSAGILLVGLLAAACAQPAPAPVKETVVVTVIAQATPAPAPAPAVAVPFLADWQKAGHADAKAEAFKHWPTETEKEIPVTCAKCHSAAGYRDFLGADGSKAGVVDKAVAPGSVIDCVACHNSGTIDKTSVVFPSGVMIKDLGAEARCMECHQGRESTVSVNNVISNTFKLTAADEDTIVKPLVTTDAAGKTVTTTFGFRNIHYFAAAATQYGTLVKGGYEYKGQSYDGKFQHPEPYNTCNGCHNSHSLELELKECATCHAGVAKVEDIAKVRMAGSQMDYDGDGNVKEGIAEELSGLQEKLFAAIQAYAKEVGKADIAYSSTTYPYFVADKNGNGKADADETSAYPAWTPRLLKAAYNYQVASKDPGKLAHNAKYVIQLMYDSIADLNTKLAKPVDMAQAVRNDAGHFAGSTEPFRHWDAEGEVPAACAKCHTATGLPEFIKNGGTVAVTGSGAVVTVGIGSTEPSNGLACSTCHSDLTKFTVRAVTNVPFPSGKNVTFSTEKDDKGNLKPVAANLCLECHQGRESTASVNAAIKGLDDDKVDAKARFRNVHYFAAGASLFGTQAQGAYEYEGKKYVGKFAHTAGFDTCTGCHNTHKLELRFETCATCHAGVKSPDEIRMSAKDFDGDKDVKEGISGEVMAFEAKLYDTMIAYSKTITPTGIAYNAAAYPYFFKDTNGDGKADEKEAVSANGWSDWTPRLLRAAYNYQYVQKDPGVFAHNAKYAMQILYDTLEDLGKKTQVDMTGLARPE